MNCFSPLESLDDSVVLRLLQFLPRLDAFKLALSAPRVSRIFISNSHRLRLFRDFTVNFYYTVDGSSTGRKLLFHGKQETGRLELKSSKGSRHIHVHFFKPETRKRRLDDWIVEHKGTRVHVRIAKKSWNCRVLNGSQVDGFLTMVHFFSCRIFTTYVSFQNLPSSVLSKIPSIFFPKVQLLSFDFEQSKEPLDERVVLSLLGSNYALHTLLIKFPQKLHTKLTMGFFQNPVVRGLCRLEINASTTSEFELTDRGLNTMLATKLLLHGRSQVTQEGMRTFISRGEKKKRHIWEVYLRIQAPAATVTRHAMWRGILGSFYINGADHVNLWRLSALRVSLEALHNEFGVRISSDYLPNIAQ